MLLNIICKFFMCIYLIFYIVFVGLYLFFIPYLPEERIKND